MRILWREPKPTFHGSYVNFDNAYCQPQPVQRTVPIIVGGHSPAVAPLVPVTSMPGLPTAISSPDDVLEWRDTLERYAD